MVLWGVAGSSCRLSVDLFVDRSRGARYCNYVLHSLRQREGDLMNTTSKAMEERCFDSSANDSENREL